MRFLTPVTLFSVTLFLSGCVYVNNEPQKQTQNTGEPRVSVREDAEWLLYGSNNTEVKFKYPKNVIRDRGRGSPFGELSFIVWTKQDWEKVVQAGRDNQAFDDKCEYIGDLDCADFNWQKQYEAFYLAVAGKGVYGSYDEAVLIQENLQTINGLPFIVGVNVGINGSCQLHYVTFKKETRIEFIADVCGDKIFKNFDFGGDYWSTGKFSKELYDWVDNVINGQPSDYSTKDKKTTLLEVIRTIE